MSGIIIKGSVLTGKRNGNRIKPFEVPPAGPPEPEPLPPPFSTEEIIIRLQQQLVEAREQLAKLREQLEQAHACQLCLGWRELARRP